VTAIVLNNMGCAYQAMGEHDRAVELCAQALGHFDKISDPYGAAQARDSLALAYRGLGRLDLRHPVRPAGRGRLC
jgi:hypothetical protein